MSSVVSNRRSFNNNGTQAGRRQVPRSQALRCDAAWSAANGTLIIGTFGLSGTASVRSAATAYAGGVLLTVAGGQPRYAEASARTRPSRRLPSAASR